MTATSASITLVASQRPPMPTSTTATSTGASANAAYAMTMNTSKNDSRGPPCAIEPPSTMCTYGATSCQTSTKRSSLIGSPSIADPLVDAGQVRAGEAAGAQPVLAQQRLDHAGGRRLAVRAGDVHRAERALRVAQQVEHRAHAVERRVDVVLGRPREDRRGTPRRRPRGRRAPPRPAGGPRHRARGSRVGPHDVTATSATSAASIVTDVARVSAATNSRCASTSATCAAGTASVRSTRSATCSPAALRASCTARTTSRAYPSARRASSRARSSTTTTPPGRTAAATSAPAPSPTTVVSSYSAGSSATSPSSVVTTTVSPSTRHAPARAPLMTGCTARPRRGPAARALTASRCVMPNRSAVAGVRLDHVDVLDVELGGEQVGVRRERGRVGHRDREPAQRLAHAHLVRLAQAERGGHHGADLVHRGDERVVADRRRGRPPASP